MSTLFRYLAREILFATALLLAALLALFALIDFIQELGHVGKGSYRLSSVITYVLLSLPSHVPVIVPIAALLGTLLAVARLSLNSELTVMRASGLSLGKIAGFAVMVGLLLSAVTFAFSEYIGPLANDEAKRLKLSATSTLVAKKFRSGFWVKDDRSFVNIQNVTPETELQQMRIYEFDRAYRLTSISVAKAALYEGNNHWALSEVERTTFENDRVKTERQPKAVWNSAMTPELLAALRVTPEQLSLLNLTAYIDYLRDNKQDSMRYELAFWAKVFQPFTVIVMMLLAIPFALNSHRAGGVGAKLLVGIMIGLVFYFLSQLSSHLAVLNSWPSLVSTAAPILLFLGVAAALLVWKEHQARLHWR